LCGGRNNSLTKVIGGIDMLERKSNKSVGFLIGQNRKCKTDKLTPGDTADTGKGKKKKKRKNQSGQMLNEGTKV